MGDPPISATHLMALTMQRPLLSLLLCRHIRAKPPRILRMAVDTDLNPAAVLTEAPVVFLVVETLCRPTVIWVSRSQVWLALLEVGRNRAQAGS